MSRISAEKFGASVRSRPANGRCMTERQLHRIATVRRREGISQRSAARRLNVTVRVLDNQEQETADLRLSELYRWQEVLDVPITELLLDNSKVLSTPVRERAGMVRVMKTAASILENAKTTQQQRLARNLVDQLLEMMPELEGTHPWHSVGRRRATDEYGRIAHHPYRLREDLLDDA